MRVIITAFFCFLVLNSAISQETEKKKDTTKGSTKPLLSQKAFNLTFTKAFTQFASGQENTADLANHAAFDPSNSTFSLNGFLPLRDSIKPNPSYLSFRITGGLINGNATTLFSDKKLNSNVNIDLKYHFLFRNKQVTYDTREKTILEAKKSNINATAVIENEKRNFLYSDFWLQKQIQAYEYRTEVTKADYEKYSELYQKYELKIKEYSAKQPANKDSIKLYADSIGIIVKKMQETMNERIELKYKQDSLIHISAISKELNLVYQRESSQKNKQSVLNAELEANLNSIRYSWLTFSLAANKKSYLTFYDSLQFNKQIKRNSFDALNIGIEWNVFWNVMRVNKLNYFTIGFLKSKSNNLDELSPIDIEQERKIVSNDTTRKIVKKYSAYTTQVETFQSWMIYSNYYFFFGKKSKTGFHIFPEFDIRDNHTQRANLGLGVIVAFKDDKKDKNILNVEAYTNFKDLANKQNSADKFYERLEIGLRVGLPIKPF